MFIDNMKLEIFEVFPWSSSFEVGNALIDEQHKSLVRLLNELAHSLVGGSEFELNTAFDELTSYAEIHFADEEEIFAQSLPVDALASHHKEHQSFFVSVAKLRESAANGSLSENIEKIIFFLLRWLVRHIIHSDKRMVLIMDALDQEMSEDEARKFANDEIDSLEKVIMDTLLNMYNKVSARTIALMKEIEARKKAEKLLAQANALLNELVLVDQLTGLFNRRHLENVFTEKMKKAIRDKTTLSFLLLDVDFFKNINDTFGHAEGDYTLKLLGECLLKLCRRPDDIAFRIGGEEFCIVSANQTKENIADFAEIIRMEVEKLKLPSGSSEVSQYMTISVGVAHKIPQLGESQDTFFKIADDGLYRAKAQGRNKVVFSV